VERIALCSDAEEAPVVGVSVDRRPRPLKLRPHVRHCAGNRGEDLGVRNGRFAGGSDRAQGEGPANASQLDEGDLRRHRSCAIASPDLSGSRGQISTQRLARPVLRMGRYGAHTMTSMRLKCHS